MARKTTKPNSNAARRAHYQHLGDELRRAIENKPKPYHPGSAVPLRLSDELGKAIADIAELLKATTITVAVPGHTVTMNFLPPGAATE